jgi:hypothetical protein
MGVVRHVPLIVCAVAVLVVSAAGCELALPRSHVDHHIELLKLIVALDKRIDALEAANTTTHTATQGWAQIDGSWVQIIDMDKLGEPLGAAPAALATGVER